MPEKEKALTVDLSTFDLSTLYMFYFIINLINWG